jgi:hypothetical protein
MRARRGSAHQGWRGTSLPERLRGVGPWSITIVATIASTYALDVLASAAGILLVASGLLAGADRLVLLASLGVSYVFWGLGLRSSLRANWLLLERTGASSNALSKVGYDISMARTTSARVRRAASAFGYLGTELLKELPYYAGAVGAAVLSESVTADDALIFLCGTNLGAAAYEYALALGTRWLLRRGSSG